MTDMHSSTPAPGDEPPEGRELRRSYHDQISEVRESSQRVVAASSLALGAAIRGVLDGDGQAAAEATAIAGGMGEVSKFVDGSVLDLLALESPVARDLRLLIASRDVAQIGMLTLGLCATLAGRAASVHQVLSPDIRSVLEEVHRATSGLWEQAGRAWTAVDAQLAQEVRSREPAVRVAHLQLLTALIGMRNVPMDAALNLGMVARAYERITDHAVEIAQQVSFVIG